MKLSYLQWMLGAAACVSMVGCSSAEQEWDALPNQPVEISVSQDDFTGASSRTVIGDELSDGSLVMQWAPKEQIGVFGNQTSANVCFTSTNSAPANKTGFSGLLGTKEVPAYAYYPYAETANTLTAIPVHIPTEQHYKDASSVAAYDVKASNAVKQLPDGTYEFQMQQMVTLIRFDINLDEVRTVIGQTQATDEKLMQVDLSTPVHMTGDYTYNLQNLEAGMKAQQGATGELQLKFDNTPLLSNSVMAYAIVVPGAQKGQTLSCVLRTSHHKVTLTTQLLSDFRPGYFYTIPLNAKVYKNPSNKTEVVEEPYQPVTPPVEPVTEETANCYMINQVGEHSFVATQIGNGDKGIIPNAGFHVTSSRINPQSAKLMWEDTQGFIDASSIRLEKGRVYYQALKNVGNAQIAVYSGKNCTGEILWSWHIWGVGDTMPSDITLTNQAQATFQVMDRALGTLALPVYGTPDARDCMAMLYQWGRKDPIPNASVYYVDNKAVDITNYPVYEPTTASEATILTSVQHCNEVINDNVETGNWNWLGVDNAYLWGDTNLDDCYTWYSSGKYSNPAAGAQWTHQKTIYDPSPVGYRVANKFTFTGFAKITDGTGKMDGDLDKQSVEEYTNFVVETLMDQTVERARPKFQNGYFFKQHAADTEGNYFPMTGKRHVGGLGDVGVAASYWTSAQQKNENQGHCFQIGPYEWRDVDNLNGAGNHGFYKTVTFSYKWVAFAVRCVRE